MPFTQATNDLLDAYLAAKDRFARAKAAHESGQIVAALTVTVEPRNAENPMQAELAAFAEENMAEVLPELSGRVVAKLRRDVMEAKTQLDTAVRAEEMG
jgi:hypothetical protein